ncbi:MAG: GNAT family N-acetyltransferase [Pacificimonas sp.]
MNIRPTDTADIPALMTIADATGLFPGEMLPDMVGGALADPPNGELWLTAEDAGIVVGFCYAVPEMLAGGSWNMLAIGVLPGRQGEGVGRALCRRLETALQESGARILIADTSGTDGFDATGKFYAAAGYSEIARIPEFWGPGDDKVTFWKAVSVSTK